MGCRQLPAIALLENGCTRVLFSSSPVHESTCSCTDQRLIKMAKSGDKKRLEENKAHLRKLTILIAVSNVMLDHLCNSRETILRFARWPLPPLQWTRN